MSYTPGPWHYQEGADSYTHIVRGPNNDYIVGFSEHVGDRSEANARLTAAAPELLDFVRKQRDETNCICGLAQTQRLMGTNVECTHCVAEKLIAKAEGRMPQSANAEKSQPVETAEESANDTNLLLQAVKIIRQFHAIPLADRDEKQAWSRYYNRAAEMRPIREALEKAGLNP